ncbi:MAG: hypothetical protein LUQ11_02305 [Methylococcaceae bacterium]|nr:hypothetical protein [Methylococcaceae bacterium]
MNNPMTELENWLAGGDIVEEHYLGADSWIAGFDADRQAVVIKLGPFKRLFLRPEKFTKRFYHQLHPLTIEIWPYRRQIKLFDDFCTVDMVLDLRFQATLSYVQRNSELLPTINQHIKRTYADLLDDIVNRELQNLGDGSWVHTGLSLVEQSITRSICEQLAIQQIQSQAICNIKASFEEFPAVQPGRDNVYLNVLKKTFEINDQKNRELIRQQRMLEQQEFEEKQRRLEHLKQLIEIETQAQAIEAEKNRRLLEEKEDQLSRQLAIEKRIHAEQLRHEAQLKEMLLDSELRLQEQRQAKQRLAEIQQLNEQLAHQARIEDTKIMAELARGGKVQHRPQDQSFRFDEGGYDANQ